MAEEQTKLDEEKEEVIVADEALGVGHAVNMFNYILIAQKSIADKKPLSDGLTHKHNN